MLMETDDKLDSLVLDLLEWIAKEPRSYRQTMEAWRTSCPRLPVWEEAVDRQLVERKPMAEGGIAIVLTAEGRQFLARQRGSRIGP
jgi:hypothetical protein